MASPPRPADRRPHPDALTRREVAEALGQDYDRVYFWTRRRDPPVVTPSLGGDTGKGDPAWFTAEDLDALRDFFAALDTVQAFTGSRIPRGGFDRARRSQPPASH